MATGWKSKDEEIAMLTSSRQMDESLPDVGTERASQFDNRLVTFGNLQALPFETLNCRTIRSEFLEVAEFKVGHKCTIVNGGPRSVRVDRTQEV